MPGFVKGSIELQVYFIISC